MKPTSAATIFQVNNVETSIQYYTAILGFEVAFRYNDLAGLEYGPVLIYLSGPKQDAKKAIGQGSIYIFIDEVDAYYNDIIAKGALLTISIDDRPYGMRDFGVKDPDGNYLAFGNECPV